MILRYERYVVDGFIGEEGTGWDSIRNYNIFLVPPQILLNKKSLRDFCRFLKHKLESSFDKNEFFQSKIPLSAIYIVTSFAVYNSSYSKKSEMEIVRNNIHLSFFLGSTPFIKTLNIPKDTKNTKKWLLKEIVAHDKKNSALFQNLMPFRNNIYEHIYLNLNLLTVNRLPATDETSGSHGKHVTPFLYSNERFSENETIIENDLETFLILNHDKKEKRKGGVIHRILLIDDKLNDKPTVNGKTEACKAKYIKFLLELEFDEKLKNKVCWLTPTNNKKAVRLVYFTSRNKDKDKSTSYFDDVVPEERAKLFRELNKSSNKIEVYEEGTPDELYIGSNNIKDIIQAIKLHANLRSCIQIVAVKNIKDARTLLASSDIRFDLMLVDYLLHTKENDPYKREYGTSFWFDRTEQNEDNYEKLFELESQSLFYDEYRLIKENRGPMKKLWIFPITAFNQTFIDDLRNEGIRLIDYYWYLSRGADPINTPCNFIYSINKFLQLQLKEAVFSDDDLKRFLEKSIFGLKSIGDNPDDFIAYMGAEYTVFVEKYCNRPVIFRDMKAGSLFAKYIWDNFYTQKKFIPTFRFVHYLQKFFHKCAFGSALDAPQMLVYWNDLYIFVNENQQLKPESDLHAFRKKIKLMFP